MPRARAAAPYDRKSSVTNRAATKAYFKRLPHRFQSDVLVNKHIENLAMGDDSAPQIDHPPIDLQIDFIKMLDRMRLQATFAQMRGDHWPEVVYTAANGFIGDRDAALGEQILDITKEG
jgi:hypothetical protein